MNIAVQSLRASGVVTVVAAGNSNVPACEFSPAGVPEVYSNKILNFGLINRFPWRSLRSVGNLARPALLKRSILALKRSILALF